MRPELLSQFSKTVESIYSAALDPPLWPAAIGQVAALQGAERAALLTPSTSVKDGGYLIPHNVPAQVLQEWGTRYVHEDPWVEAATRMGVVEAGRAFLGEDLVNDDALVQTNFYRNFLSRQGIRWLCTGVVFDGALPDLPLTSCSVYRGAHDEKFDDESRHVHSMLIRHLSCALGTMYKLRDASLRAARSVQALDTLPDALGLVGHRGNVLFANRAAHRIFQLNDGLTLRAGHPIQDALGWLKAFQLDAQARLDQALKNSVLADPAVAPSFMDSVSVPRRSGMIDFVVRVVPLSPSADFVDGTSGATGLFFLTDPADVPALDRAALQTLYGITPAEARVAQDLLYGESVNAMAVRLRISEATVRSHLQSLFAKTSTTRQSQLVRLLLALRR